MRGIIEHKDCGCDVCTDKITIDEATSKDTLCSKCAEIYDLTKEHPDGRWYKD